VSSDYQLSKKLSVAPMMDWTDRHYRYFIRLISKCALLYTEMVTSGAVIHGDREKLLGYSSEEHPIALQLGGSDPKALAECAKIAEDYGYDEININVGCPSDRVQSGKIGACLMAEPELVAECVAAMKNASKLPITVKHRIGIEGGGLPTIDSYESLAAFVGTVATAGCSSFTVHARIAVLTGLSPKQNREVPPLKYDFVYQLKQDFPELEIALNGGIKSLSETQEHLEHLDGVMIGREAYQNPYCLAGADQSIFAKSFNQATRIEVAEQMIEYVERHIASGGKLQHISRHMLGLFHAQPNGKQWRRYLSEMATKPDANAQVLIEAINIVS
jgi:tRNA-dihydrouridine synthase A